ncbi:MAG: hypothetical protein ACMVY4_17460 [Minwuia sp.]|uniref:hypothetical protein n=1 Tax=Minwuia sp. TaxID=2493630 RepID=UPI003A8A448B
MKHCFNQVCFLPDRTSFSAETLSGKRGDHQMKRTWYLLPAMCLAIALGSCDVVEDIDDAISNIGPDDPSLNQPQVQIEYKDAKSCSCTGSKRAWLVNLSNDRAQVEYLTSIQVDGKIVRSFKTDTELDAKKKRSLSCTIVTAKNAPVNQKCTQMNVFEIKSQRTLGNIKSERKLVVPDSRFWRHLVSVDAKPIGNLSKRVSNIKTDEPMFNCRNECGSGNGGYCLIVELKNYNYSSGLAWLIQAVESQNRTILEKSEMLDRFGLSADPCRRGNTFLSDGMLYNTGQSCQLIASALGETVEISVPGEVSGKLDRKEGFTVVEFETLRPKLTFSDQMLNEDVGGEIYEVSGNRRSLILTTTEGCIAARLK